MSVYHSEDVGGLGKKGETVPLVFQDGSKFFSFYETENYPPRSMVFPLVHSEFYNDTGKGPLQLTV